MHNQKLEQELENLIREVRVAMPGVQILFAFLLTVPFNTRFATVDPRALAIFMISLGAITCASFLFITPTVYHRLHRRRDVDNLESMLSLFNRIALAGSVFLAVAIVAGVSFLAEFLFGYGAALAAALATAAVAFALWYALPWLRHRHQRKFHAPLPPRGRRAHDHFGEAFSHR